MNRPRLLDLFCGQGGAARGYADAGWDVTGVDIDPQPRYPYRFIRANVITLPLVMFQAFDAIHASPPCQFGTAMRHAPGARPHLNLIPGTRALVGTSGLPWVIENVDSDAVRPFMPGAVRLCGSMFGLGYQNHAGPLEQHIARGGKVTLPALTAELKAGWFQLRRHRLFCTNWGYAAPGPCAHTQPVVGVYGGHARNRSKAWGGRRTADFEGLGHGNVAGEAMGIDWMTTAGLSEAIPPAYTMDIGRRLMEHLRT